MSFYVSNLFMVLYLFTKATDGDLTHVDPAPESLTSILNEPVLNNESTTISKTSDHREESTLTTSETINAQTTFDMKDFKVTTLKDSNFEEAEENDGDTEDTAEKCLAMYSPEKVEAVRKTLKNDGGRVKYVFANPPLVTEEELKISACLKKVSLKTKSQGDVNVTVAPDAPMTNNNTSQNISDSEKVSINQTEGTATFKNSTDDQRRVLNDNEYQFESLHYNEYDIGFDDNICPEHMHIVHLEIGEVKQYDLECEKLTYWLSLSDVQSFVSS